VQPTHGRSKRVADALGQVALRADQRAQIEELAKTAESTHAAAAAAQQDFAETLATQVTAGALDRDALTAKVARVSAAWAAAQPTERASFEALHGILDAGQRAELVAAMKAQQQQHGSDHPKDKEFEGHKGHGPGERWADALQLSDEQRTAFKSILHEAFASFHGGPAEAREHHHGGHGELLEAFQGDTFSFDAVVPPHDVQAHVSEMSGHLIDVVEKVLPLLTAEQRTLAAQLIRDHADHLPLGER
jgi:hypothetical protein